MSNLNKFPQAWPLLRSEDGPEIPLFQVKFQWMRNPRNGLAQKKLVLETCDWVNIVAVTPGKRVVMVRQFRFGIATITTEIPGGIVDPGETSRQAAERELREETGYRAEEWLYLGAVQANPAIQNNLCHHWLARQARKLEDIELGEGEDLNVLELTVDQIKTEIEAGRLLHSLALSALSRVFDLWERPIPGLPPG